jgi:hypothetical protein
MRCTVSEFGKLHVYTIYGGVQVEGSVWADPWPMRRNPKLGRSIVIFALREDAARRELGLPDREDFSLPHISNVITFSAMKTGLKEIDSFLSILEHLRRLSGADPSDLHMLDTVPILTTKSPLDIPFGSVRLHARIIHVVALDDERRRHPR